MIKITILLRITLTNYTSFNCLHTNRAQCSLQNHRFSDNITQGSTAASLTARFKIDSGIIWIFLEFLNAMWIEDSDDDDIDEDSSNEDVEDAPHNKAIDVWCGLGASSTLWAIVQVDHPDFCVIFLSGISHDFSEDCAYSLLLPTNASMDADENEDGEAVIVEPPVRDEKEVEEMYLKNRQERRLRLLNHLLPQRYVAKSSNTTAKKSRKQAKDEDKEVKDNERDGQEYDKEVKDKKTDAIGYDTIPHRTAPYRSRDKDKKHDGLR
ncbi:hypothetical protein DFJ58DRAFT_848439 [Suillus subalutaceus]|uniref:uncharacterized protein n=1 Tax=Suillus subalutaceus TaxID=48586 RepID=UPI001B882C41|nr:uncharacterized protein DFJ58DRAFT_848439 [Suillus subalutaceus]KAG1830506.1 hypothetical protein DFJ58DRAFT_848439 [Suillus subalutaceus]